MLYNMLGYFLFCQEDQKVEILEEQLEKALLC